MKKICSDWQVCNLRLFLKRWYLVFCCLFFFGLDFEFGFLVFVLLEYFELGVDRTVLYCVV